jgi:serine/threonine protein kinase
MSVNPAVSEWKFYKNSLSPSEGTITCRKVKKLAEGSFANIYLVYTLHDPSQNWVLKESKSWGFGERTQEARILKVLNEQEKREGKEYIIQLVAFSTLSLKPVMLFPHYPADLFDFTSKKPLTLTQASEVARQLLETAAFLQRQRLIHRDIKPENILVKEIKGSLKISLADFGSAIWKNASTKRDTSLVGTLNYTSPELIHSFQHPGRVHPYDFTSDMWAIGCSLFNIVSVNELFFLYPDNQQIRKMIGLQHEFAKSHHRPISTLPNIDDFPVLRDILVNTLQTDPWRRFSARDCLSLFELTIESESQKKDASLFSQAPL